jgi:hypothetical protein
VSTARVKIEGLDEFRRSLDTMRSGLPKMVQMALGEVLGEVVDYARPRMPKRTGRAAQSLRAKASARTASVTMGGPAAPYAPWLDFGGQGRRKGRPPARPFLKQGRYVYKALAVRQNDIDDIMSAGLDQLARGAGLDVT